MDFTNFATETSPDHLYLRSALANGLAWAGVGRRTAVAVLPDTRLGRRRSGASVPNVAANVAPTAGPIAGLNADLSPRAAAALAVGEA